MALVTALPIVLALVGMVGGQSTLDASCLAGSGVTTFKACNAMLGSNIACREIQQITSKLDCFCQQEYINTAKR